MNKQPEHWAVVERDSGHIAHSCSNGRKAQNLAFSCEMLGKNAKRFYAVQTTEPLPADTARKWSDGQPYHINDYNPTGKEKGSKA